MNWTYINNTNAPIIYRSETWLPNETHETAYPVPDTLGLTCIQEGSSPDPIIFHDDIIVQPNGQEVVNISPPKLSHAVDLSIRCITHETGCECRFNSLHGCAIPIDFREFRQITSWNNCSRIYLINSTDIEAHISVTAFEAVR